MPPDWRPQKTVRDPAARKAFHRNRGERGICAVCGISTDLSLHHVFGRDDVPENFVFLCGDGVRGCHGLITRNDQIARAKLGAFIVRNRPDVIEHAADRGGLDHATEWFSRRLFADVSPILIGNTEGT